MAVVATCRRSAAAERRGGSPARRRCDTFTNPVVPSDAPDPQAIQVGDDLVPVPHQRRRPQRAGADVAGPGRPGRRRATPCRRCGSWAVTGKTWAPEVVAARHRTGTCSTTRPLGRDRAAVRRPGGGAARRPGPTSTTRTRPLVCQADQGGSIDASPFRDDDGSLHLLWKNDGNAVGLDTWIWSQPLSADGVTLTG